MAKKQEPTALAEGATQPPTQQAESKAQPKQDIAVSISARTGMGITIIRERMIGNEEKLAQLLEGNDTLGIQALLEPSNKA